jgi:hypothetical protein
MHIMGAVPMPRKEDRARARPGSALPGR